MKCLGIIAAVALLCRLSRRRSRKRSPRKWRAWRSFPASSRFTGTRKPDKVWLEIDKWNTEFLYVESLPAGIGSNDIGLDRGQLGNSAIVRFDRTGPRVLLVAPNYDFRAITNNADERLAVKDAFAESTLWGFEVAAEEGGRVLVDATNFYLRDVHQVTQHAATRTAGNVSTRSDSQRVLSSKHEKLSAKHGSRNHADFHRRAGGPVRQASRAGAGSDHGSRASFVRATAAGRVSSHECSIRAPVISASTTWTSRRRSRSRSPSASSRVIVCKRKIRARA